MKKLLLGVLITVVLAACGTGGAPEAGGVVGVTPDQEVAPVTVDEVPTAAVSELSVLTWDRGGPGHQDSADNYFTRWIQQQMLEETGIEVSFLAIGRWDEHEILPTLMAAGTNPDLAMTWNAGMVQHFGRLGGITDLNPLLQAHIQDLPYLDAWLDNLLWQEQDPATGELYSILQRRVHRPRTGTFIRADWLETLNLPLPETTEQFVDALKAFRDNADVLGAGSMTPLAMTQDVRWRASTLLDSFLDLSASQEEMFPYMISDRHFLLPGFSEGVRLLSYMFDEGLIFPDFPMHPDDQFTDDFTVAGQVGSYIHVWDNLFRATPGVMTRLQEADPNARFVPIDPFINPATGLTQKVIYPEYAFHVFIPANSRNPVGALQYLNWMSRLDNRLYLQMGEEGYHHQIVEVGDFRVPIMNPDFDNATSDRRMYSPNNIDLTLVINGVDVGDFEANIVAMAQGFTGIDYQLVIDAYTISLRNGFYFQPFTVPDGTPFSSEFQPTYNQMVSEALINVITAPYADFDTLWDQAMQNILDAGATMAIEERRAGLQRLLEME